MDIYKILLYLVIFVVIVQIIRQIMHIVSLKYFPKKCVDYDKTITFEHTSKNLLLIGDDTVLGLSLFNCNDNLGRKLSATLQTNVYVFGKEGLSSKDLSDYIRSQWFSISKIEFDYIIISIGHNDIMSLNFDVEAKYYKDAITLLMGLTKNIYILSPRDYNNDMFFVFPLNLFVKYRVSKLFDILNTVANDNKIGYVDIRKDIMYHCNEGKYCRVGLGYALDQNGYQLYNSVIHTKIVDDQIYSEEHPENNKEEEKEDEIVNEDEAYEE